MTMISSTDFIALDFETSDTNRYTCDIVLCCIQYRTHRCTYHRPSRELRKWMQRKIPVVMHNASFDLYLMENRWGIPITGPVHDTYLMAKHWNNYLPAYDLKSLSWWLFGDTYDVLRELRQHGHDHNLIGEDDEEMDMTNYPVSLVERYCAHDVSATLSLARRLYPEVMDNFAYQQDTALIRTVSKTMDRGIRADLPYYRRYRKVGMKEMETKMKEASRLLNTKHKPTGNALRGHLDTLGVYERTRTGMTRADDAVLKRYKSDAIVSRVQRIRTIQKEIGTYVDNILMVANTKTGMFHPHLIQSGANTRRFRAKGFYGNNGVEAKGNCQNFPRGPGIRTGIITPDGYAFAKLDLASIEPRMNAHAQAVLLSNDQYAKMYRTDPKFNMYLHVLKTCTGHGDVSKKDPLYTPYKHGVLGITYGVGPKKYYRTMVDDFDIHYTQDECFDIYTTIKRKCPEFSELQRTMQELAESQGYIRDDFGAIYYMDPGKMYAAVNKYCQGCAGNVLKWWWLRVDELTEGGLDYVFNTVHDELDMAIHKDAGAQERLDGYCNVLDGLTIFELPIVAETSGLVTNWGEAG